MTDDEGTQQWKEFAKLWIELLPNDRRCVVITLMALQPQVNTAISMRESTIHHAEVVNRR